MYVPMEDTLSPTDETMMEERAPLIEERLSNIERDSRDHAKSISVITDEMGKLLEWRRAQDLLMAREDERDKALYRRLDDIERSIEESREESRSAIKEIRGAGAKLQWMVIGVVVAAFVGWLLKGGISL